MCELRLAQFTQNYTDLEAPTRFELVMKVLQTFALPLGDGATSKISSMRVCQFFLQT